MKIHTEILTPQERARQYAERQIIPARNPEHAAKMERDLHRLRIEYLQKLKRARLR